jgi:hypothetical protein
MKSKDPTKEQELKEVSAGTHHGETEVGVF